MDRPDLYKLLEIAARRLAPSLNPSLLTDSIELGRLTEQLASALRSRADHDVALAAAIETAFAAGGESTPGDDARTDR